MRKSWPEEPLRLPVKLEPTSNGEFVPAPESPQIAWVRRTALERIDANARRLQIDRRELLRSLCGAATVFLTLNALGCRGGHYAVRPEAELETAAAEGSLAGDEVIFDVQTHHVAEERTWWETDRPNVGSFLQTLPQASCGLPSWVECFGRDTFLREIFLDSDTSIAVLSMLWGDPAHNPLHAEEAALTRERVAMLEGSSRLLIHGIVLPRSASPEETRDRMSELADRWKIAAWKLYPLYGPDGKGWWLDDDTGERVIADGLAAGVRLFAVHKGLPLPGMDPAFASAKDVGAAARAHPEATFLIYHSGYEPDRTEGPYDPNADRGIDALIRSVTEAGAENVYAELGSVWRHVMGRPDEAAHVLGKLLVHFGPDRILWGTDCIWYGSPQDQIQAFRAFTITPEFQERYGYPALTPETKRKILGENAARVYGVDLARARTAHADDPVERARALWRRSRAPSHATWGPRTRREFFSLLRQRGGLPA